MNIHFRQNREMMSACVIKTKKMVNLFQIKITMANISGKVRICCHPLPN